MTDKFVTLYEPGAKSWSFMEELNIALNWTDLTSQTGSEYFQSNGVSQKFTNEFIEGATRLNYAQVRRTAYFSRFRPLISLPRRVPTVFMDWKPLALLRQTAAVASKEECGKSLSNSLNGLEHRLSSTQRWSNSSALLPEKPQVLTLH